MARMFTAAPAQIARIMELTSLDVDASRHLIEDLRELLESSGGLPTGAGAPLEGELISEERGTWNDHTQSWEKIGTSRAEKAHGLVQQRERHDNFSREYEHYVSNANAGGDPRRLLGRDDNPEDDH